MNAMPDIRYSGLEVSSFKHRQRRELMFFLLFSISIPQVTYSFCKEFITLLLHYAQPSGYENKTTHILTKLFQKVVFTVVPGRRSD